MERQRAEARKAWAGSGEAATEAVWFALRERVGASEFLGYETEKAEGVVTGLVQDGREVEWLKAGERGAVIVNQTPFYGEFGRPGRRHRRIARQGHGLSRRGTQKKLGDIFVHEGDGRGRRR